MSTLLKTPVYVRAVSNSTCLSSCKLFASVSFLEFSPKDVLQKNFLNLKIIWYVKTEKVSTARIHVVLKEII